MGELVKNYPQAKIAMQEWAAMGWAAKGGLLRNYLQAKIAM